MPLTILTERILKVTLWSRGELHELFVVDLLHEIEICVWKSVLTHLIQILYACHLSWALVTTMDER